MDRWRAGDNSAIQEIWEQYGRHLRCVASRSLRLRGMHVHLDSDDICQSVVLDLLRHAPKAELHTPAQLAGYLARAVEHKVQKKARRSIAQRRDIRRVIPANVDEGDLPAVNNDPAETIVREEMLVMIRGQMSEEDWRVLQMRLSGQHWSQIAALLYIKPDALRIRFARLLSHIRRDLNERLPVRRRAPGTQEDGH
jgi:DNA-directed RNA polymerase specialized sigma24 family protein